MAAFNARKYNPVIGIAGGVGAMLPRGHGVLNKAGSLAASLWPWPLVALFALLALMGGLGSLAEAVLLQVALALFIALVFSLVLTVISAWARDSEAGAAPRT